MTKRKLSTAARAAGMIRKEIKKHGIKARVTSKTYSMGSSVSVRTVDLMPATRKAMESYCRQFEYGTFDGMTDSYHYCNKRDELPQVRHVLFTHEMSDSMSQAIYSHLRERYDNYENLSKQYDEAKNEYFPDWNACVSELVWRVFSGSPNNDFWAKRKPRTARIKIF